MRALKRVMFSACLGAIGIGILLVIIGFSCGAGRGRNMSEYGEKIDKAETASGVENINLNIDYGQVHIVEGREFSVDARNVYEKAFKTYVTDGTWNIEYKMNKSSWGITLVPFGAMDGDPEITITIPEKQELGAFTMKMGAGVADTGPITSNTMSIGIGAGKLSATQLKVSQMLKLETGAGAITANEIEAGEAELKSGAGRIEASGRILNGGKVNCGVGEIKLRLAGDKEEYSYSVNCGVGTAQINGKSYHGFVDINNPSNNRLFKLICGVGKITLDFDS